MPPSVCATAKSSLPIISGQRMNGSNGDSSDSPFSKAANVSFFFLWMTTQQKMAVRVIVCEGTVRRMTTRPNTIEDLIGCIKCSIEADYNFTLQYEDPEFNIATCNLRASQWCKQPRRHRDPIYLICGEMQIVARGISDSQVFCRCNTQDWSKVICCFLEMKLTSNGRTCWSMLSLRNWQRWSVAMMHTE